MECEHKWCAGYAGLMPKMLPSLIFILFSNHQLTRANSKDL